MKDYFVLDMGGTYIKHALMNENAQVLEQGKFPSETADLNKLLDDIAETAAKYRDCIAGVAVSMPGRIDTANGIAHTGGSFRFFRDTPFGKMLEEHLGLPVTLGNDGKCAAMAEVKDGALAEYDNGAVVVLGTGIGGGVILNRKVWMGATGGAGEFSWLLKDFSTFANQPFDYTNAKDLIWAGDTSAPALMRIYADLKNTDPSEYNGVKFFEAYDAGDPDAKEALKQLGRNTVAGIYAVQSVLDLQCYAIGGGISARKEVAETIRECLEEKYNAFPYVPFGKPEIVNCRYGNDANLIGALRFHLERMKEEN
jgi:predicted NBD/HSP70 family sugar kinase